MNESLVTQIFLNQVKDSLFPIFISRLSYINKNLCFKWIFFLFLTFHITDPTV